MYRSSRRHEHDLIYPILDNDYQIRLNLTHIL